MSPIPTLLIAVTTAAASTAEDKSTDVPLILNEVANDGIHGIDDVIHSGISIVVDEQQDHETHMRGNETWQHIYFCSI